jgi:hypothetical protein
MCDISALGGSDFRSYLGNCDEYMITRERVPRMNKILIAVVASIALASVAGCANIGKGKGKGKAPPPVAEEPAPVYK